MTVLGLDIGGKSRNGFCVMDSEYKIKEYSYIQYDNSKTAYEHRIKINNEIERYLNKYNVDCILFEKVMLYRGQNVSPLANIMSLCRVQTSIIDKFSDRVDICEIPTRTWKSRVLGSAKADKNDAIDYVRNHYPDVNLEILVEHKRKDNEIIINHDLADSICIGIAGCRMYNELKIKGKVNYN